MLLRRGVAEELMETNGPAPITGSEGAIPNDYDARLAWQVSFGTEPTAVQVDLEATVDGINWKVIDSTSEITGDVRIVIVDGLTAIRPVLVSMTGGDGVKVHARIK